MQIDFSWKRLLVDGTILSVLLTIIAFAFLHVNPLILVDSYPPDVRAAVGEVDVPIVQTVLFYVASFGVALGVPLWSNARLRQENGGLLSFWSAALHSALLFLYFAVWDLLIMDWLVFVTILPGFVVIPGTEGLAGYRDYWFHFEVSFLGWAQWISIVVGGLLMGGLAMIRLGGKRRS
jgi:hypothetical protein